MKRVFLIILVFLLLLTFCGCNEKNDFSSTKIGDSVFFGIYDQDTNLYNEKTPIEWLVLDKQGGKILLLSKYIIDRKPFNSSSQKTDWENSELRKWLNTEFYDNAFNEQEKELIILTTNPNPIITRTATTSTGDLVERQEGADTQEKVFLLSSDEANIYKEIAGVKTTYRWMLRTTNFMKNPNYCDYSSGVNIYGVPYESFSPHSSADGQENGLRPAIWISID